jgi:hypothetical protein
MTPRQADICKLAEAIRLLNEVRRIKAEVIGILGSLAERGNEIEGAELLIRAAPGVNAIALLDWRKAVAERVVEKEDA